MFLETCLEYTALSYSCGEPSITRPILVDGCILNVTTNLELALRRLRLKESPEIFWVDAISINQEDATERAIKSVGWAMCMAERMGSVYGWERNLKILHLRSMYCAGLAA